MAKIKKEGHLPVPKALAEQFGIHPGESIRFEKVGNGILLSTDAPLDSSVIEKRLESFDRATRRMEVKPVPTVKRKPRSKSIHPDDRGWSREELYLRGRIG